MSGRETRFSGKQKETHARHQHQPPAPLILASDAPATLCLRDDKHVPLLPMADTERKEKSATGFTKSTASPNPLASDSA